MAKPVGWWFKGTHLSRYPTEMIKLSRILFYSAEHIYHFGFSLHSKERIIRQYDFLVVHKDSHAPLKMFPPITQLGFIGSY